MKLYVTPPSTKRGGPVVWINRFVEEVYSLGIDVTHRISDKWDSALFIGQDFRLFKGYTSTGFTGYRVANGYNPEWFQMIGREMRAEHHTVNSLIGASMQKTHLTIFQSQWARTQVQAITGVTPDRFCIIHNGVDTKLFSPSEEHNLDIPVLGMTGNFRYHYRLDTFFKIASKVRFKVKLLLVGHLDQESINVLKDYRTKTSFPHQIIHHQYVYHNQLPIYYRDMSVFIHPVMGDVCPNVVCEALACGVPVVTPAFGGTADLVGAGGIAVTATPWVYDEEFIDLMTVAVEKVLHDHTNYSSKARKQAEFNLNIQQMTERYLEALGVSVKDVYKQESTLENKNLRQSVSKIISPSIFFTSLAIRKGLKLKDQLSPPFLHQKPRIAFTLFDFQVGGIESWLFRLASTLKGQFKFYFLATRVAKFLPHFEAVGECAFLPDPLQMIRYLRINHIDLVQIHNQRWPVDASLAAGVPRIIERLGGPRSWLRVPKYGLDFIIASSKMAANALKDHIPSDRIEVIYNGIDLEMIDQRQMIRLFPESTFIVGRTSRFGRGQNLELLVEATSQLAKTHPEIRLVLVGGDSPLLGASPVLDELKELVDERDLTSIVKFTGTVDDPIPFIKGVDVGTCVSNDEGIPNSLIEAMACRKPVIATNVGAISELVEDSINGILIPPGDISKLCDAIIKLAGDYSIRTSLSKASRETIEQKFDIKVNALKYANLYKNLLR